MRRISCLTANGSPTGWTLFALLAVLGIVACNPRTEGCLDIEASNFDFSAERGTPELCEYPNLLLNVFYVWGDTSYVPGAMYTNAFNQSFLIQEFYVLLSQFTVQMLDPGPVSIRERIPWFLKNQEADIEVLDDFTLVDRSRFTYTLGTIDRSDFATEASFWLAVPDTLTPTDTDSLPENSSIADDRIQYDDETGRFALCQFVVVSDTASMEQQSFVAFSESERIAIPVDKEYRTGRDDTLKISLDLQAVFLDIDLEAPDEEIVRRIAENLGNAIKGNE